MLQYIGQNVGGGGEWGSQQIIPHEGQFSISATKKKQLSLRWAIEENVYQL